MAKNKGIQISFSCLDIFVSKKVRTIIVGTMSAFPLAPARLVSDSIWTLFGTLARIKELLKSKLVLGGGEGIFVSR